MIRLEVIALENLSDLISNPDGTILELIDFYKKKLSEAQATLYKVVYNFYYPETEDEKLDDTGWD